MNDCHCLTLDVEPPLPAEHLPRGTTARFSAPYLQSPAPTISALNLLHESGLHWIEYVAILCEFCVYLFALTLPQTQLERRKRSALVLYAGFLYSADDSKMWQNL